MLLLLGGAGASSAVVLAVGGIRVAAGLAPWVLGAAAAVALLALLTGGGQLSALSNSSGRAKFTFS